MKLETNIQYLKGVGEKRAKLLGRLGVFSVGGLLRLYPRAYEDWSHPLTIAEAPLGEVCCLRAMVAAPVKKALIRQGMTLYHTWAADDTGTLRITIFNNKYAAEKLKEGETYLFYGKISGDMFQKEMTAPQLEAEAEKTEALATRPTVAWQAVYPQTEGLYSRAIERLVRTAFASLEEALEADPLPADLREAYCLMSLRDALWQIHFPEDQDQLIQARRRLIFEELLVLQLGLFRMKGQSKAAAGAALSQDRSAEFFERLPFRPTGAQLRAVKEAEADMKSGRLMNRLLQGDVGSGKTAVAAALIYSMAWDGYQCAFMAPTEVLARQHYKTLSRVLERYQIRLELLVGSVTAANKRNIKERLRAGEIDLIIGTHALIQTDVQFQSLGLVVTDEQHRFGVNQRAALSEKGDRPHMYVMSATPIPRTLALIIYGDLDVSILDEMPPGRQTVETYAVGSDKRLRALGYVKKHLDRGLQGYIVCPTVEEGELELAAAVQYAEELAQTEFRQYRVGLLHGKMKPAEKQAVMAAFESGELQLLVSTTVIEVGVDVPNAVIMVIENAERFGLSQLHQLRGRVGRGSEKSTCILISDAKNEEAVRRLQVLCSTTDGFKIADEDLKLRGPGDFFGARQHGLPQLHIADMLTDTQVIAETQQLAQRILREDPALSKKAHAGLSAAVGALFASVGEAGLN